MYNNCPFAMWNPQIDAVSQNVDDFISREYILQELGLRSCKRLLRNRKNQLKN